MKENLFQKSIIEKIKEWNEETDISSLIENNKSSTENIISDFWKLLNSKWFKKYKVVINWEKWKVISYTPQKWIFVKFDNSWEIKHYSSIEEINTFKILKEIKKHKKQ